ncbi:TonB-dependent receptor [uncultured Eudoraea sp.]|uniref:TonB-dependent receptor family protein n=1 Tax=uncultured Eudoraea sp. TaxID=1035614 RepID=UPI0026279322|nr:TonB-dependent receptor [uncultured Eudoraea sp.]
MKRKFLFLILITSYFYGVSQESEKDSITYLKEVIIYNPGKIDKTLGITETTIIREKAFQNHSPIDVASSINQISGVYLLSGALNTNRITIRGVGARTPFGTDKLRLYFQGIPVTNGTGFSTIEAFDLENLASIEVVKGPKATAYGTNLGGAILLKTKERDSKGTLFANNFTLGSYGLLKDNFSFDHTTDHLTLNLRYNHLDTDGYRENNSFKRDGLLLNASMKLSSKSSLAVLANYIDYTAQIPSSLGITDFTENPRQAAFTWNQAQGFETNKYSLLGLSYTLKFSPKLENTTSLFYTYLDHYEARPFNILDEFTNGYGFRTQFNGNFRYNDRTGFYLFGGELYKDEYNWKTFENLYRDNNGNGSLQGDQLSENKEYRRQFNAFATVSIPFTNRFNMQLGVNVNKTVYDFRDLFNTGDTNKSARRNFDLIVMPGMDLIYRFWKGSQVYANISRGFSNPGLEETLTPEGVINPEITQEKGMNYEIGTKMLLANNKLWLSLALFRMHIDDLLVAQRVGEDQFIGKNAGSTRHQGLELDLNYTIDLSSKLQMTPFASYTLSDHKFVDFVDGNNDYSGNPLTGVPKNRINLGLRINHTKGFYWNTTYQYVDAIPLTDANSLSSEPYNLLNTRLGYKKELVTNLQISLDLGINNIFNVNYAQSVLINALSFGGSEPRYYYPGNDRNFYASLGLNYQL